MVIQPEILILDEATSMLDPRGKAEILALIREMKKENPDLTIVSITHDVEEAYLSNRIILMHKGEIVSTCSPSVLYDNPELISKYNLDLPFEVKLKNSIKELGINISKEDSLDEIGEKICKSR